jgi:hypothetical protein
MFLWRSCRWYDVDGFIVGSACDWLHYYDYQFSDSPVVTTLKAVMYIVSIQGMVPAHRVLQDNRSVSGRMTLPML